MCVNKTIVFQVCLIIPFADNAKGENSSLLPKYERDGEFIEVWFGRLVSDYFLVSDVFSKSRRLRRELLER
jgi:hypothetical protein